MNMGVIKVIKMIDFFIFNYIVLILIAILAVSMVLSKKRLNTLLYLYLMSILVSIELALLEAYTLAIVEFIIGTVFIQLICYFLFKNGEALQYDEKDLF